MSDLIGAGDGGNIGGFGVSILVNLIVTSAVDGGAVKVDVGSPAGPTGSATQSLFNAASGPERVTCTLYVQTLSYFFANGARLFVTASVPVSSSTRPSS